jgi:DNA-binding MarR family transcriptional regulator
VPEVPGSTGSAGSPGPPGAHGSSGSGGAGGAGRVPGSSGSAPAAGGGAAFLVAQVGAQAAARFAERLAALDLAPPHAGILRLLAAQPGISQQGLAERLEVFPSRLVALVDELAERGLVERRDDPSDRRAYSLHLTPRGHHQLQGIGRVARQHQDALLAALAAPEREQLASLLRRIADEQGLTPLVHPGYRRLRRPNPRSRRTGHDRPPRDRRR